MTNPSSPPPKENRVWWHDSDFFDPEYCRDLEYRSTIIDLSRAKGLRKRWSHFDRRPPEEVAHLVIEQGHIDLSDLPDLPNMEELTLSRAASIESPWHLQRFPKLRKVHLARIEVGSWVRYERSFGRMADPVKLGGLLSLVPMLEEFSLHHLDDFTSLAPVAGLWRVRHIELCHMGSLADITSIATFPILTSLVIHGFESLEDLAPLATVPLRSLRLLGDLPSLRLELFEKLRCLRELEFWLPEEITELSVLGNLPRLERLALNTVRSHLDLTPLQRLPQLREVDLSECSRLERLDGAGKNLHANVKLPRNRVSSIELKG